MMRALDRRRAADVAGCRFRLTFGYDAIDLLILMVVIVFAHIFAR